MTRRKATAIMLWGGVLAFVLIAVYTDLRAGMSPLLIGGAFIGALYLVARRDRSTRTRRR